MSKDSGITSNGKFKIVYLGEELQTSKGDFNYFLDSINDNKFQRTKLAITDEHKTQNIEDLTLRSSWTYDEKINIYHEELDNSELKFKLLKYEKNDFFKLHKDHKGTHTCLIIGGKNLQGGILTLTNNTFEIKINPEEMGNGYYMIIFSIDFLHEVSPIIAGKRFVLKTTLFNNGNYVPTTTQDCKYEDSYSEEEEAEDENLYLGNNFLGENDY